MPCFSNIQTAMIDLPSLEKAAEALGIRIVRHTANRYTLTRDREYIDIERAKEGEKFSTVAYSGSNNWPTRVLEPLIQEYAKVRTKAFYKSKGYTASVGRQPNQVVFTAYN